MEQGESNRTATLTIQRIMARYARAIDRLDRELLLSVYWPEAVDDHGPYKGPVDGFVDWVIPFLTERFISTNHFLGQTYAEVSGERAVAETLFTAWHVFRDDPTSAHVVTGRYADVYEQRGGEWRILDRTVLYDWEMAAKVNMLAAPFSTGLRSREDHTYTLLRQLRAGARDSR